MDALPHLVSEKNAALFEKYSVLSKRELESRHEIFVEQYFRTVNIEGETAAHMVHSMFLPAANRYLTELLNTAERADDVGLKVKGIVSTARTVAGLVDELTEALAELDKQNEELGGEEVESKAEHMRKNVIPAMNEVRAVVDRLEKVMPDDLWPVPTYRDMLLIK
jgi:glutamine synthetase